MSWGPGGTFLLPLLALISTSKALQLSTQQTFSVAEETLESALDTVTKSYSCGQTAEPFDHPHMLHNATPALIQPHLQTALEAGAFLSVLPPDVGPKGLGLLWRTLRTPRTPASPIGLVFHDTSKKLVWFLRESGRTFYSASNNTLAQRYSQLAGALTTPANNSTTGPLWSRPFWDCDASQWVLAAIFPVASRGSLSLLLPLKSLDVDQCDDENASLFKGTHKCDPATSTCVFVAGRGFCSGAYSCRCVEGFFDPEGPDNWTGLLPSSETPLGPRTCVQCPDECQPCKGGRCEAKLQPTLRAALLATQAVCMTITFVISVAVFRNRKRKPLSSSMWTMLETILFGTFLLYAGVLIRYFNPSVEFCLLETWCREFGFVICYGAIILKLYKILIEFRTRKAHRWVVRDKDLLKYLTAMVLIAFVYLAGHTATALHTLQERPGALMARGRTLQGVSFPTCKPLWWELVTQAGEFGLLIFGLHLSVASRNAFTQYREREFLCAALVVELLVSVPFYALRALAWPHLHPDVAFTAYVARSQLTNSIVLLLIFVPKWWYCHLAAKQKPNARPYPLLGEAPAPASPALGACVDADFAEVSLADMNPEDIRAELKRLYTQLEVLKNKTIRYDNPHISKRRGGRKVAHRRFSLQKKGSREKALHHRQKSSKHHGHHDNEDGGEVSRTPEDSVCSIEGPSAIYNDGPSVAYSEYNYSRK
ncbi:probable G-protein coupled receptor 158 isoform X2 [Neocloeon triangulifer]|uniref:probable G-protein coupled receptor 158 isoform X2 n=1 Tax=Neocloeon triangulifer TaxID=2078957 RepID=UPI00286F33FD|nr:probable G-protein coupled receptor 158 isoform X2 [Neocloeon triangulifer]